MKFIAHNKHILKLLVLVISSFVMSQQLLAQISVSATLIDHKHVQLSFEISSNENPPFTLFRTLPQSSAATITIFSDSQLSFIDTLPFVICDDTVRYFMQSATTQSNTAAINIIDNQPTSECSMQLATVNDTTQLITLSWDPNPDLDIMGYYLCSGFPCTDYDTIWGRTTTQYLCLSLSATQPYTFRLLAFDSCMQASPLTPPMGNMVLQLSVDTITRRVSAQWNPYQNLPGGLSSYALCTRYSSTASWDTIAQLPPSQTYYTYSLSNTQELTLQAKVVAISSTSHLQSSSNIAQAYLPAPYNPNPDTNSRPSTDSLVAFIPNVFTPSQPTNSTFCPVIPDIDPFNYIIFIYNRNGTLVFSANSLDHCWDGLSPQGAPCPQGVYTYTIRARRFQGGVSIINGQVLLLR